MCHCRHVHDCVCSYEQERPVRVKTIHIKGVDNATLADRERYLYKPTFKPLWCNKVRYLQGIQDNSLGLVHLSF